MENNSNEEITIESIAMRKGTLNLCQPSAPKNPEELVISPRTKKQIMSWSPSISPTSTLRWKEPDLKDGRPIEIDFVVRTTVLGRVRTFSHTIIATVNYQNQSISQFGG
jgi:hypothetical protein